jgi:hypothetical protein
LRTQKKAQNRAAGTRPPPSLVQEPNHLTLRFAFLIKESLECKYPTLPGWMRDEAAPASIFVSAPLAFNNDDYVCRKVCQPMRWVTPTVTAAGRMILRINDDRAGTRLFSSSPRHLKQGEQTKNLAAAFHNRFEFHRSARRKF